MAIRIGIMGFGRIGRNIFRILHGQDELQVVAISDIAEPKGMEYLLRFDTVHGKFPEEIRVVDDALYAGGRQVKLLDGRAPGDVDWAAYGVDIVVEATNRYRTRAELERHLEAGARNVILASPPKFGESLDALIVSGVNDDALDSSSRVISKGSSTINAAAPILKVIHENFGIEHAYITSVHAYTNAQRLADVPGKDLRMSRAAAENIIPTDTFSPLGIGRVVPELEGRLSGRALAVPVPDGSNVDMTLLMEKKVTRNEINEVVRSAAASRYRGIIQYTEDPIVSSDVIGNPHSAVFDSLATLVLDNEMVKTITWYDNGWGYAARVVELIARIGRMQGETIHGFAGGAR